MNKEAKVSLVKCEEYKLDLVISQIQKIIKSSDFPEIKNKIVLLKPNILSASAPEKACTTHPIIIQGMIRVLKDLHPKQILVGDSPGVGNPDIAGKKSGIKNIVEQEGATWAHFKESTSLYNEKGKKQKQFFPVDWVNKIDVLISMPKMKTHEMMYYTGAIKNLFGMIPGLNKSRFHMNYPEKEDFAALIVDLFQGLKPDYALMDGIISMEGPGPGSGFPKQSNFLLGSSNLLALDWATSLLMGYDPLQIPILKEALEREQWLTDPKEIEYPLLNPQSHIIKDFKRVKVLKDSGFIKKIVPPFLFKALRNIYVPKPFFNHHKCILCGKCIEICPAKALSIEQKKSKKSIAIDYSKCIRCYCCHEVCPVEAIRISRL